MMDFDDMHSLVRACTYKPGWLIHLRDDGRPYIQVEVTEEAEASMESQGPNKGVRSSWKGGKTYLSPHMCRQEIIGAVLSALQKAELHETMEWFRYRGASIYNPHLDPDVLWEVARKASSFNTRQNAMSMEEVTVDSS